MKNGGVANRSVFESEILQDGYPDVFIYQINLPQAPTPLGAISAVVEVIQWPASHVYRG
jgi:hypothetical protein